MIGKFLVAALVIGIPVVLALKSRKSTDAFTFQTTPGRDGRWSYIIFRTADNTVAHRQGGFPSSPAALAAAKAYTFEHLGGTTEDAS